MSILLGTIGKVVISLKPQSASRKDQPDFVRETVKQIRPQNV